MHKKLPIIGFLVRTNQDLQDATPLLRGIPKNEFNLNQISTLSALSEWDTWHALVIFFKNDSKFLKDTIAKVVGLEPFRKIPLLFIGDEYKSEQFDELNHRELLFDFITIGATPHLLHFKLRQLLKYQNIQAKPINENKNQNFSKHSQFLTKKTPQPSNGNNLNKILAERTQQALWNHPY